ncbi:MAG: hypothetical protein ABSD40_04905 [Streptosporangiaceae bacterium]|jgi:hypothetical protein
MGQRGTWRAAAAAIVAAAVAGSGLAVAGAGTAGAATAGAGTAGAGTAGAGTAGAATVSAAATRAASTAATGAAGLARTASAARAPRVDLKVLVISDGSAWMGALTQQLASEGVPATVISLSDSARPVITSSLLSGKLADGTPVARYQGVVLPDDAPAGLSAAELSALASYESAFSVRQVDGYEYPSASVGLSGPAYGGPLDGSTATITGAAKAAGFGYLRGSFRFEGTRGGATSYGYLARPLAATARTSFTPFLTEPLPGAGGSGTAGTGALAGVYSSGGRQQLELGFGYDYYQLQYRYLAHGIVNWLTRGIHLGFWRNYLTVDAGDVLSADPRWSPSGHCTPGHDTCPPGTPATSPIRMTPADVTYARNWQRAHRFTLELLVNGGSSARYRVHGTDPLLAALRPAADQFRWVNDTYTGQNLGCVPDYAVAPWRCQSRAGRIAWVSKAAISSQITGNISWARRNGIPAEASELATSDYTGLRFLPQQPADNPNLVSVLRPDGIRWIAMDASTEPAMRPVGAALGLPRHPIDVFYNVTTPAQEVSEYNWLYDSAADGGSGACSTVTPVSCLTPLRPATGWNSFIRPLQVTIMLGSVLQNDPRPFYLRQSNLTGGRLGYPVIDGALAGYRSVFSASAPVVSNPMSADGAALHAQQMWARALAAGSVRGYVQGGVVTITGPAGTSVPVTAPDGTRVSSAGGAAYGAGYAGQLSARTTLGGHGLKLALASTPYPAGPATAPATAAAARLPRSTAAINAAANPAQLPGGALGEALRAVAGAGPVPAGRGG